ncbi:hypothetical protein C8R45DRAFT_1106213 [Mycena sanguinolenta]|nr:hypothetical protein C8R45DRAFT_1106213 [Mycena sanguinolenta]
MHAASQADLPDGHSQFGNYKFQVAVNLLEARSSSMAEVCTKESASPTDRKIKVEHTPKIIPGLKVEKVDSQCSSTSEIAVLRALLEKKEKEALAREIGLGTQILELKNENKRLKQKREADFAKIASLEGEVARSKNLPVKREDPQPPKTDHAPEGPILASSVLDSDDEETEGNHSGAPDMAHVPPSPLTSPDSSPGPATNEPSRDASSPVPESDATAGKPPHNRDSESVVQPKEETIDVIIKKEGEPDQFKRVMLIKSEDGKFDIWNVDGFDLGPTIQVDPKYLRGFTRKVISDALGGGLQCCCHNWTQKPEPADVKTPFVTFNRTWNNALPTSPGLHGMVFSDMTDSPIAPEPINFFVGEGKNNWRLSGTYDYLRWGHIAPHHISLLPVDVLNNWVAGTLETRGGKDWVEKANERVKAGYEIPFTWAGILQALKDGRLEIPFSILRCVGYPEDWFEKLLYYEKHPLPKKTKKSTAKLAKRPRRGQAQGSPKKRAKGSGKVKREDTPEPLSEDDGSDSDGERLDEETDDDDEDFDGGRQIATLPTRKSPRKKQRSQSVEL